MTPDKTYIKMCEKSKEIQALSPLKNKEWLEVYFKCEPADILHSTEQLFFVNGKVRSAYSIKPEFFNEAIWLPRQEQLQEMFDSSGGSTPYLGLFVEFTDTIFAKQLQAAWKESPLHLWLAFVMARKFNKQWDDEKEEWREL